MGDCAGGGLLNGGGGAMLPPTTIGAYWCMEGGDLAYPW